MRWRVKTSNFSLNEFQFLIILIQILPDWNFKSNNQTIWFKKNQIPKTYSTSIL